MAPLRSLQRFASKYVRDNALRARLGWSRTQRYAALGVTVAALIIAAWAYAAGRHELAVVGLEVAVIVGIVLLGEVLRHPYVGRLVAIVLVVIWLAWLFAQQEAALRTLH